MGITTGRREAGAPDRSRFSRTAFGPPALPTSFVSRPRLLARLDEQPVPLVQTITGPPGSGKTALVTDWTARQPDRRVAWLNADAAGGSAASFWEALLEAVIDHGAAQDGNALHVGPDGLGSGFLEAVRRAGERLDQPITVVIDDVHLAPPEVHLELRRLLTRPPTDLRLVLVGRAAPAIGLDRLRLHEHLGEITGADLRLTPSELAELVSGIGTPLDDAHLETLHQRTRGWVATARIAAVAAAATGDPGAYVDQLGGTTRPIADYLATELLDDLPREVLDLVVDLCVADELTPALAAALAPERLPILPDLEQGGLLERTDVHRERYRLDPLVEDLLRQRLRLADPPRERRQHLRAAEHLLQEGDLQSAFRSYWRGGDTRRALSLVSITTVDDLLLGSAITIGANAASLTDQDLTAAPGAAVTICGMLASEGLDVAEDLAQRIETHAWDLMTSEERVQLLALRSAIRFMRGDTAGTRTFATAAVDLERGTETGSPYVGLAEAMGIRSATWDHDLPTAQAWAAAASARQGDADSAELLTSIGWLHIARGEYVTARAVADKLLAAEDTSGPGAPPFLAARQCVAGIALLELGELAEAECRLTEASEHGAPARRAMVLQAHLGLARLAWADGRADVASEALASARSLAEEAGGPNSALLLPIRAFEVDVLIDRHHLDEAAALLDLLAPGPAASLALARLQRALGCPDLAAATLDAVTADVPRLALDQALARMLLLADAEADLRAAAVEVFDLAEPMGAVFAIAAAGSPVLDAVRRVARVRPETSFVTRILQARPHAVAAPRPVSRITAGALTERERTVLRYLTTSMTYREIGAELYVSINTVKTHVTSIISKLGADSRAEALRRAHELGYL